MSPSGKVHFYWWKKGRVGAILFGVAASLLYWSLGLGILSGYLLGRWIEPDLDMVQTTTSEYRAMRELKLFGVLLVCYWLPYGFIVPHRHFLSHSPIISTIIRFVYQFWRLWIFLDKYGYMWNSAMLFGFLGLFIGLCLSDLIHIFLDYRR